MKNNIKYIFTSLSVLWISYIFLGSLPYKFSNSLETQYIFGTIGEWIGGYGFGTFGSIFGTYGGYIIGLFELLVSLILLLGLFFYAKEKLFNIKNKKNHDYLFGIGGICACIVMSGAIFFHLVSPLGIEVNNDGGSLFRSAVSIFLIGVILFALYYKDVINNFFKSNK